LYELVSIYPNRLGKGFRAAVCFAACGALGGSLRQALNSAVAIELFHNAFLAFDDFQDGSITRRGSSTLHRRYGTAVALNVANATNLLGLQRVLENREILGSAATWLIAEETSRMMQCSLEGQAIEIDWIRENVCTLGAQDYLRMCLKKTSWYSFIYPLRVGAIVAQSHARADQFCRFGWYLGAAFQVQDDILNLTGEYSKYRKEIGGDLLEGKRTLMLIHLLNRCGAKELRTLRRFLGKSRDQRSQSEIDWIYAMMLEYGCIAYARKVARQLAGAALLEGLTAFRDTLDSEYKQFILQLVLYVVMRNH